MTLASLFAAQQPIPLHALAALAATILGAAQLWAPKGTAIHRRVGRIWVGLMAFVAFSGFFIHELKLVGPFSPIHLLSAFTLVALWYAVHAARQGNIRRHRTSMMALFWMALILTGAFTFLPGRLMHQVVTGG
jgi:uncharacterized membrane protein|tara:strand:- start:14910 stop:15308 length:399 start_codon:yes stop_codon:yes gene_type:complete